MTKNEKLKYCKGCEQNFYNGNNNLGVNECWHLQSAKIVLKKEVHINQQPPWNQKAQKFLDCYKAKGFVYVNPDKTY